MDRQVLAAEYENRTDDELLRLAIQPEGLTPEAKEVLRLELDRRGIGTSERLKVFEDEEEKRQQDVGRNPGSLFIIPHFGIGRLRFGKASRSFDAATGVTRFHTTVFVVFLWSPLFPTGTYLAELHPDCSEPVFLEKLALDWEQILKVWLVAACSWLAVIWAFKFLRYFLLR